VGDQFWRIVFLTAAIFNSAVGLSVAFDTSGWAASLGVETLRYDTLYSPLTGMFIVLFGGFYIAVARDLENRAIVVVSTLGKLTAFMLVVHAWARGLAPAAVAALAVIDLVYAMLFTLFLLARRDWPELPPTVR